MSSQPFHYISADQMAPHYARGPPLPPDPMDFRRRSGQGLPLECFDRQQSIKLVGAPRNQGLPLDRFDVEQNTKIVGTPRNQGLPNSHFDAEQSQGRPLDCFDSEQNTELADTPGNPDMTVDTYERLIDNVKAKLKQLNQTLNVLETHKKQHLESRPAPSSPETEDTAKFRTVGLFFNFSSFSLIQQGAKAIFKIRMPIRSDF